MDTPQEKPDHGDDRKKASAGGQWKPTRRELFRVGSAGAIGGGLWSGATATAVAQEQTDSGQSPDRKTGEQAGSVMQSDTSAASPSPTLTPPDVSDEGGIGLPTIILGILLFGGSGWLLLSHRRRSTEKLDRNDQE